MFTLQAYGCPLVWCNVGHEKEHGRTLWIHGKNGWGFNIKVYKLKTHGCGVISKYK
jgi:hypothetical protein